MHLTGRLVLGIRGATAGGGGLTSLTQQSLSVPRHQPVQKCLGGSGQETDAGSWTHCLLARTFKQDASLLHLDFGPLAWWGVYHPTASGGGLWLLCA